MTITVLYAATPEGRAALVAAEKRTSETALPLSILLLQHETPATPEAARAVRDAVRDDIHDTLGADAHFQLAEIGPGHGTDAVTALIDHIADTTPELFVVGSKRRSTVGKLLLGRDLQRLVLEVTVPILLIKPDPR